MSNNGRCATCGNFCFFGHHTCPPSWLVHVVGYHDDGEGVRVYAPDAQEAAEKWADDNDCYNDYVIISGTPATVLVRPYDDPDATPEKYTVTGESVPEYHAEPA